MTCRCSPNLCRHGTNQKYSNYGLSVVLYSVCGDDPSIQQSSHATVYTSLQCHTFTFTLFSTLTILFACPIMHDKLITYCCSALFTYDVFIVRIPPAHVRLLAGSKISMTFRILPLVVCLKDFRDHCAGGHSNNTCKQPHPRTTQLNRERGVCS